ncbi:dephospho-CoA kinase [Aurantibacter crassamenti]|uniref:dephospho-CoA kinase n=1 Tax=Aurantibacter crassamenti TaxID=1837375 RepID=UPI001EEF22AD|nr:dephospho-CoA kinase [Aurantibacter crassamenti]
MIVGLTGGIGSGKTTVAKLFKALGVPVYNSDKEAKKLMNSSKELRKSIKDLFGKDAYKKKKLNRAFIAEQVFADKEMLKKLNAIVHPAVRNHFKSWVNEQDAPYVIQEAAIIFEQNNQDFYDKIVLVTAPKEIRIERVLQRDTHQNRAKIEQRMANQLPDSEKIRLSDYIIENIVLESTENRVKELHQTFLDCC